MSEEQTYDVEFREFVPDDEQHPGKGRRTVTGWAYGVRLTFSKSRRMVIIHLRDRDVRKQTRTVTIRPSEKPVNVADLLDALPGF